jgi:hypothetical protein
LYKYIFQKFYFFFNVFLMYFFLVPQSQFGWSKLPKQKVVFTSSGPAKFKKSDMPGAFFPRNCALRRGSSSSVDALSLSLYRY